MYIAYIYLDCNSFDMYYRNLINIYFESFELIFD
jgi:hypothetical protein